MRITILAFFTLIMIGCGGGGGDSASTSGPTTNPPPTTPPPTSTVVTLGTRSFDTTTSQDFSTHLVGNPTESLIFQYRWNSGGTPLPALYEDHNYTKDTLRGVPCWRRRVVRGGTVDLAYYAKDSTGAICAIQFGSSEMVPFVWLPASLTIGTTWASNGGTTYEVVSTSATSPAGRTGCVKFLSIQHDGSGVVTGSTPVYIKANFGLMLVEMGADFANCQYLDLSSG